MFRAISLSILVVIVSSGLASQSRAAGNCPCDPSSIAAQAKGLKSIAAHVEKSAAGWPSAMEKGNASYYAGKPSYARKHGIKFWAATPIKKKIKPGICLMVTSKAHPENHVAVVTADVGPFDHVKNRVLDLSVNAARKIDPSYKKTGSMDVTAVPVDMSVCKSQT